ncbi:unnamed protein product, partial [Sphacelaria rigidula]
GIRGQWSSDYGMHDHEYTLPLCVCVCVCVYVFFCCYFVVRFPCLRVIAFECHLINILVQDGALGQKRGQETFAWFLTAGGNADQIADMIVSVSYVCFSLSILFYVRCLNKDSPPP